ncbi:MAG: hypothetical protein ABW211_04470 [Acidimicrobiia bacterium]
MRFLLRIAILGLAAFGAKSLYDLLAPRKDQFRSAADGLYDRTTTAAREVGSKVSGAAQNVASSAQTNAAEVKDTVRAQADEVAAAAKEAVDESTKELDATVS